MECHWCFLVVDYLLYIWSLHACLITIPLSSAWSYFFCSSMLFCMIFLLYPMVSNGIADWGQLYSCLCLCICLFHCHCRCLFSNFDCHCKLREWLYPWLFVLVTRVNCRPPLSFIIPSLLFNWIHQSFLLQHPLVFLKSKLGPC